MSNHPQFQPPYLTEQQLDFLRSVSQPKAYYAMTGFNVQPVSFPPVECEHPWYGKVTLVQALGKNIDGTHSFTMVNSKGHRINTYILL